VNKKIRIGSRGSALAVRQAEIVVEGVKESNPAIEFEIVTFTTTGDRIQDKSLDDIGGKGLFIKELEQALLNGDIDIAIHSYKDMPHEERADLPIVALSKRESPFDVLVLPDGNADLDGSKPVGSSSRRRTIQFNMLHPNITTKPIRGNVLTRLSKLDNGEYSALIIAQAGLNRLSLQNRISHVFTADEMIPSASQGILAVQGRQGEDYTYLSQFHNRESEIVSRAERQYLKTLNGGCSSPVAAYARLYGNEILLMGMYVCGTDNVEIGKISGDVDKAEFLGETLAKQLLKRE